MLPQGMFSVAVATVLFPTLARLADARRHGRLPRHGLARPAPDRLPARAGRASSAPCWRSRSSGCSTSAASSSPTETTRRRRRLAAFSLGLTFNGMMLMLNRGFFSLQAPWMPTAVALGEPRAQRRALRGVLPRRRLGDPARDLDRQHRRRRAAPRRAPPPPRPARPDRHDRARSSASSIAAAVARRGRLRRLVGARRRARPLVRGAARLARRRARRGRRASISSRASALRVREMAALLSLRDRFRRA